MSDKFNKIAKGAGIGALVAAGAAIVLPVVTVSASVLAVGGIIGGLIAKNS